MANILVIGAHPDDEVLGSGGTIARHAEEGDAVYVCILSEGVSAQYDDRGMIDVRREAAQRAGDILGVRQSFYFDLPDSKMEDVPHLQINAILEGLVRDLEPQTVYTHFRLDTDRDHQRTYESTMVAARPKLTSPVRRILCYEVPGQTHWFGATAETNFIPNVYVDIAPYLGRKLEAMSCYESEIGEFPFPRSLEAVETLAKWRGVSCGIDAAEAFMLVREISVSSQPVQPLIESKEPEDL